MSEVMTDGRADDLLRQLDESAITRTHWKIMFISGMGFFTDAYDLFVIGVVMSMLKEQWHVSPTADGLVTSTALLASAIGAVLFGRIADMLGRKRIYGYEVLVLAAGALASALSPDIWWLIGFRFILGIILGLDPRARHRRRLPGELDDHERICRQEDPWPADHAGVRDAGRGPGIRSGTRRGAAGQRPVARHHLAVVAGIRRHPGDGSVLDAAQDGGNASLPAGKRPA
jgi:hypothetical protein